MSRAAGLARVPAVSLAAPGRVLSAAFCPQGPGWSCTSAMAAAAPCPRAARSRCQPRSPSTTGTWRRSCWTPSMSRAGAAPGRAPTVTALLARRPPRTATELWR
uniref:Uncharacterized protein n=1 Tax=Zonotrichia albicollis TaxID=44394 RepID=A0A8D2N497_ZONAL